MPAEITTLRSHRTYDDVVTRALAAAHHCLERVEQSGPSTIQQAAAWSQCAGACAQIAANMSNVSAALEDREYRNARGVPPVTGEPTNAA